MLDLESMLVTEFCSEKLQIFTCALIEISLLYTTTDQNDKMFALYIVPMQD